MSAEPEVGATPKVTSFGCESVNWYTTSRPLCFALALQVGETSPG